MRTLPVMWHGLWSRHSQAPNPAFFWQVAHLRKLTCRKVSKGAWNRKWKGNRFGVRSGNPSQISLFPAVWFCSSYLITFLICKTCIIPAQVPVRLIRITYLKCLLHKIPLSRSASSHLWTHLFPVPTPTPASLPGQFQRLLQIARSLHVNMQWYVYFVSA